MSKTSRSMSYNALLTSTREKYHKNGVPQDAIFNAITTLEALRRKKSFRTDADGGEVIRINLIEQANTNGKSYAGYESANTTPQDEFTIAYEEWRQYSWTTPISGIEVFKNGGGKIFDLLAQKEEVTYLSATQDINRDIWDIANVSTSAGTAGNGGKNINSIPMLAVKAPGTSNKLHNITTATGSNTWWANRAFDCDASDAGTITVQAYLQKIRNAVNTCNRGRSAGKADLLVFDQISYELLESALDTKVQYMSTDSATAGFQSINWKGCECVWDIYVPDINAGSNGGPDTTLTSGSIFILNSKAMKLYVGKGHDFAPTPFVDGTYNGQDAKLSMTLLYAQIVTDSRRNLGVIYDVPTALA